MKFTFVVHRPYHLVRSIDLVMKLREEYGSDMSATIIIFDLVYDLSQKYAKTREYHSDFKLEEVFDHVVTLTRKNEESIFKIFKFIGYYKQKVKDYSQIVASHPADRVFIFSDKEKPVEILSSIYKTQKARILMVDEGHASYARKGSRMKYIIKRILIFFFGFRKISKTVYYGESKIVEKALVNLPKYTTIRNKIEQLPSFKIDSVKKYYKGQDNLTNSKNLIYVSNIVNYLFDIPWEQEKAVMTRLCELARANGYDFVVKPHPVEEDEKYKEIEGSILLDKKYPSELLFNGQNIFISCKSSVLINARIANQKVADISSIYQINNDNSIFRKLEIPLVNNVEELFSVSSGMLESVTPVSSEVRDILVFN